MAPDFFAGVVGRYIIQSANTIFIFGGSAVLSSRLNYSGRLFLSDAGAKPKVGLFTLLATAIAIAAMPAINLLAEWNGAIHFPDILSSVEESLRHLESEAQRTTAEFLEHDSVVRLVVNIMVIALLPAFFEEIFFRGTLQPALNRSLSHHAAVWVTAFLFSAIHFQFFGFVPRLIMGAALGYMAYYSHSLWPAIIAHFANNAAVVIITYAEYRTQNHFLSTIGADASWPFAIASLAIVTALSVYYVKMGTID